MDSSLQLPESFWLCQICRWLRIPFCASLINEKREEFATIIHRVIDNNDTIRQELEGLISCKQRSSDKPDWRQMNQEDKSRPNPQYWSSMTRQAWATSFPPPRRR